MPELQRPGCTACGNMSVAQWSRRPTDAELAAERDRVTGWRRDKVDEGHVPESHDFGPLPEAGDVTIAVLGCIDHLMHVDLAARVHAADCTAPHPNHLPACNCEPEPLPEPDLPPEMVTLPTGWVIPAP